MCNVEGMEQNETAKKESWMDLGEVVSLNIELDDIYRKGTKNLYDTMSRFDRGVLSRLRPDDGTSEMIFYLRSAASISAPYKLRATKGVLPVEMNMLRHNQLTKKADVLRVHVNNVLMLVAMFAQDAGECMCICYYNPAFPHFVPEEQRETALFFHEIFTTKKSVAYTTVYMMRRFLKEVLSLPHDVVEDLTTAEYKGISPQNQAAAKDYFSRAMFAIWFPIDERDNPVCHTGSLVLDR